MPVEVVDADIWFDSGESFSVGAFAVTKDNALAVGELTCAGLVVIFEIL